MDTPVIGRLERGELFRLLVEHVKDYAIFMLDPHGVVRSWNDGAERIKGYSAEEIIGQHFSVFYSPDAVSRGHPAEVLRMAERDGRYTEEGWRVRKSGSAFWASITVTALRDEATGELLGYAKITRDLTERKRVEEERLELLRKERAARQEAEAALARMRAAHQETAMAEEALRVKDEFMSIAAHELKTPLTAAKAATQLLVRRAARAGKLDPSLSSALEIVERQIDKLALLVTHLLETVQIQSGRLSLDPVPTDLVALASETAETLSQATGRGIQVVAAGAVRVACDALRFEQVIVNLLDNAIKHSPAGTPIDVTITQRDAGTVELAVRDHGVGVPADTRGRLFERYFQAHHDRSGMGLGLYISRMIVEKHGGTIHAEFPPDGGSRFVVSLPTGAHAEVGSPHTSSG